MAERPEFKGLGDRIFGRRDEAAAHPVDDFLNEADTQRIVLLPVTAIQPNPDQPRKYFDQKALEDLTHSVRERGVLQPIIVRKNPAGDDFLLIAGERRLRAAIAAGLAKIPALIIEKHDPAEIALIENVQREDLKPVEEAEALLKLKQARGYTDEQLGTVIGKSRPSVTELLSLNNLPEHIKAECRTSDILSKSQLLTLVRAGNKSAIEALWKTIRTGKARTVAQLRTRNRAAKGRSQNFVHAYKAGDGRFRMTITFSRPSVSKEEVREAIEEVLGEL